MVTNTMNERCYEFKGLSTDEKPTTYGKLEIGNGSSFIEMDTSKIFFYDEENHTWREFTAN